MRIQRFIAAAIRFVVAQVECTKSAVARDIANAFHLQHRQTYMGMLPTGSDPMPCRLERGRSWLGKRSDRLSLAMVSA
ncbi:hypothetical protein FF011L_50250 [Roseimaritima multifibrata]|uniref:Uncharacterized protein n=1 Tax=Roseimaritima multifibrata TaxID=1930274 RepID=A0A517MN58_9BACT|nr:hypothetical protein [Roseimaritima multifibrata]QDS96217.1 hypothetical protein FF011L_50250 [Roseimaritima multifibrata]